MSVEPASLAFEILDEKTLATWPLPIPGADGDKEDRGRVLIVAGCRELSGVAVLCATAAFRAGAGNVTIATVADITLWVGLAMPECRVVALGESADGGFATSVASMLYDECRRHDCVLIGPGMQNEGAVHDLVRALLPSLDGAKVILDAYAMGAVCKLDPPKSAGTSSAADKNNLGTKGNPFLITPHAGELAHLTGVEKSVITDHPQQTALTFAQNWNSIVALKGAITHIATPDRRVWRHDGGSVGLGTSGSGDTLAGIIAGLAARGATLEQAAAWAVVLHARAGIQLTSRFGLLGYLAREIAGEIPRIMHEIGNVRSS